MREPFKVVVWGPGGLGRIIIREVALRPEFELVGAFCFSAEKHGVDAGTLAGIEPLGVRASTEADTLLQNVPRVAAAEPGWLEMVHPVPHWAPDFRRSWMTGAAAVPVA